MLDYTDGHLRVISHKWNQGGHILVDTFALDASTTTLTKVGHLDLNDIGRLTAARFDGTRVYLVHMVNVDPLDVVDLADPANPTLLDRIDIPGWLEHLEVRDSRIVGVGYDQAGTPAPQKLCDGYVYTPLDSGRMLSVAMYDVTDTGEVCEAARVRFGTGNWQWSNGFRDDKAIKYLSAHNLLLVPFSGYGDSEYTRAVQLVDVDLGTLELDARGLVENASQVDRSFLAKQRLMVLGNRELNVANIDNRDNPVVTASLELSRNVVAFKPVNSSIGVQLVGDYNQEAELRVVSLSNADAEKGDVHASILVGAEAGELYVDGPIVTVYSRSYTEDGPQAKLTNFDVSNPERPGQAGQPRVPRRLRPRHSPADDGALRPDRGHRAHRRRQVRRVGARGRGAEVQPHRQQRPEEPGHHLRARQAERQDARHGSEGLVGRPLRRVGPRRSRTTSATSKRMTTSSPSTPVSRKTWRKMFASCRRSRPAKSASSTGSPA